MDDAQIMYAMAAALSEMSLAVYNAQTGECTLDEAWQVVQVGCDKLANLAEQADEV